LSLHDVEDLEEYLRSVPHDVENGLEEFLKWVLYDAENMVKFLTMDDRLVSI
jgi:hypothetical protein